MDDECGHRVDPHYVCNGKAGHDGLHTHVKCCPFCGSPGDFSPYFACGSTSDPDDRGTACPIIERLISALKLIAAAGTSRDNGWWFHETATTALNNLTRKESQ